MQSAINELALMVLEILGRGEGVPKDPPGPLHSKKVWTE